MGLVALILLAWGIHTQEHKIKESSVKAVELSHSLFNPSYEFKEDGDDSSGDADFTYLSNSQYISGLTVDFSSFYVYFGTSDGSSHLERDKDLKSSKSFDLQVSGFTNQIVWEGFYQNYSGFYVADGDNDNVKKDHFHEADHIAYGLGGTYFFNDSMTPQNSFAHNSLRKVSANSWILGAHYLKTQLSSSHLIPEKYERQFDSLQGLNRITLNSFNVEGGWTITHAWENNWYINFLVSMLLGTQNQELDKDESQKKTVPNSGNIIQLDIGYQFKTTNFGFFQRTFTNYTPLDEHQLTYRRSMYGFYYKFFF